MSKLKPCANCGGVAITGKKSIPIGNFISDVKSHFVTCGGITRKNDADFYEKKPCGLSFEGFTDEITLSTLKRRWNKLYDKLHTFRKDCK